MRLLQLTKGGDLKLVTHNGRSVPKYAILSHTWGDEEQEVTFKDIENGKGRLKSGFEKIRFCGEQARRDGLDYFWVDSCCIDKSASAGLSEAIISMFRWYAHAERCYVYLQDVCPGPLGVPFSRSRWFTRGWTLQELLAPSSLEFFDRLGTSLGDKKNLESEIATITGLPINALRGDALSSFSIEDRLSWKGDRRTTREEDEAYCMMGLFGLSMEALYGEGKDRAWERLVEKIALSRNPNRTKAALLWQDLSASRVLPLRSKWMQQDTGVGATRADLTWTSPSPSKRARGKIQSLPSSFWSDRSTTWPPIFSLRTQGTRPPDPYIDVRKIPAKYKLAVVNGLETSFQEMQHDPYASFAYISYLHDHSFLTDDELLMHVRDALRELDLREYFCMMNCLDVEDHLSMCRISTIVRRAQSLIILLHKGDSDSYSWYSGQELTEKLLQKWLSNCWHLEEFLLSPENRPIMVVKAGEPFRDVSSISKRALASLVSDIPALLDLVEYVDGTLSLTKLELVISLMITLNSLKLIPHYRSADRCYILSSFLPNRPAPVPTDSSFQAFVRIMLSNDVDLLLERLICIHPRKIDQPWYEFADTWHVHLRDVEPACRISGMCEDDILVLNAFKGAPVTFVPAVGRQSQKRPILGRWFSGSGSHRSLDSFVLLRGRPTAEQIMADLRACRRYNGIQRAAVTNKTCKQKKLQTPLTFANTQVYTPLSTQSILQQLLFLLPGCQKR